ncbi:MAG: hypothetical protein DMG24_00855, partial [Acidobacteria bacterium]
MKASLLELESDETCDSWYSSHKSSNFIRSPGQPTLKSSSAISPSRRFDIFTARALLVVLVES